MDTEGYRELASQAEAKTRRIEAADTPENESRLTNLLASYGAKLRRGRKKGAARYTVVLPRGDQMIGVTLDDVEGLVEKLRAPNA